MAHPRPLSAPCSFGLFTDAHAAPGDQQGRYYQDSPAKLAACVDTCRARQVPLLLNLGDLIDLAGSVQAEEENLALMLAELGRFPGMVKHVLGNHDVATFTKAEFLARCGQAGERSYYAFDVGGLHFVVLDGNYRADDTEFSAGNFTWDDAWLGTAQLPWLAADLAAAADRPALVFCHACLDDVTIDGRPDPHILGNAADVRRILQQAGNVRAVFQGHYHTGRHRVIAGVPYVALAAMVVGPGLAHNAFAIVTVHPDGTIELAGYGRQQSLRL